MTAYILSPAAISDLDSIWDYSAETWSTAQADRYVWEIRAAIEALADGRLKGRSIDNVRAGYFKVTVGSHFIVYQMTREVIDVVRIVHQRMDFPPRLH